MTYVLITPGKPILGAVMGSHAYGLARPDSDYDRKGVFVAPSLKLLGLKPPKDTITHTDPDYEYHEVGKFCRLALKCNPTVLEQLFLNEADYEVLTEEGRLLVEARFSFLSRERVRGAFGGYAMAQIERLKRRGDGSFSSDTRNRREKHARHCFRLLAQGRELLESGSLNVKVADPERLFAIGRLPDDALAEAFAEEDALMEEAYRSSDLPENPNVDLVDDLLHQIRRLADG